MAKDYRDKKSIFSSSHNKNRFKNDMFERYKFEDFKYMFDAIEQNEGKLNSWERDFIQSIETNKTLTQKQFDKLNEIHNKILTINK